MSSSNTSSHDASRALLIESEQCMVGGINSPVRAFRAVGGSPLFIDRGQGSRIFDADGNEYIDLVGSWGPLILGHAHPTVVEALARTARAGTSSSEPLVARNSNWREWWSPTCLRWRRCVSSAAGPRRR